jgi:cytochrome P450
VRVLRIVAEAVITYIRVRALVFAATDTTSNALSRILHLLATHPIIQDRLRLEIANALRNSGGREFSYEELLSLPFLDAVCRETLRL